MNARSIKIKAHLVEPKGKPSFYGYKAVLADGTLIDARFTKASKTMPDKDCVVSVPEGGCNVSYAKEYPVLYINQVTEVIENAVDKEKREKDLDNLFGKAE